MASAFFSGSDRPTATDASRTAITTVIIFARTFTDFKSQCLHRRHTACHTPHFEVGGMTALSWYRRMVVVHCVLALVRGTATVSVRCILGYHTPALVCTRWTYDLSRTMCQAPSLLAKMPSDIICETRAGLWLIVRACQTPHSRLRSYTSRATAGIIAFHF